MVNKDRTLDHLVIEALISCHELSLPKAFEKDSS